MANLITEKYFTQEDFSKQEDRVLAEVTRESGFVVEREIFRGVIFEHSKVGSIIYRGTWQGKPAVLKLQGLKPEMDEGEIVKRFTEQSRSAIVRAPSLYFHQPWSRQRGYGYLITEAIDAPKILTMPFATPEQMVDFARFYQEYRTSALTRPWLKPESLDSHAFTLRRVEHWRKVCESKQRLAVNDYVPYLERYSPLAAKHLPNIPMVFCHGHLTADDIFKLSNGSYVVAANLFWSYRPQWYDLAFNVWACFLHINDPKYAFKNFLNYVEQWLAVYRSIPVVQADPDFDRKITVLLLERTIGAILVDLGVNDWYDKPENAPQFRNLLKLHQQFIDHLADKLS